MPISIIPLVVLFALHVFSLHEQAFLCHYSNCLSHRRLHFWPHSGSSFYQLPIFLILLVTCRKYSVCPFPTTLLVFLSPCLIYLSLQDDLSQALFSLHWPKYFSFCFFINNSQQVWDLQCIVGRIQRISLCNPCVVSVRDPNNVGRVVRTPAPYNRL